MIFLRHPHFFHEALYHRSHEHIKSYNSWSVINYLSRRPDPPEDYRAQSGGLGLVDRLLRTGGIALKEGVETLLRGGKLTRRIREDLVFSRPETDENAVWSLLISAGYIKPTQRTDTAVSKRDMSSAYSASSMVHTKAAMTTMTITNHESWLCLSEMVTGWFETRSGNYMERFAEFIRWLAARDVAEKGLQERSASCSS